LAQVVSKVAAAANLSRPFALVFVFALAKVRVRVRVRPDLKRTEAVKQD
jgi:hypothetical protein